LLRCGATKLKVVFQPAPDQERPAADQRDIPPGEGAEALGFRGYR